jgi:hypothetical protein
LSGRTNVAKPVLSATPTGGVTGGHTLVQLDATVHSRDAGESPESSYTVWLVAGATKPAEPKSVASESVVAAGGAVGVGVGAGVTTGAAAGAE